MPDPQTELIVTANGSEVARYVIEPGEYVIGRDAECQVVLNDEQVSARHAKLVIHDQEVFIEDLGSANGTFVNGQRISGSTKIEPGHQVQIGSAALELRLVIAAAETTTLDNVTVTAGPSATANVTPPAYAGGYAFADELRHSKKYEVGRVVARGGMGAILDARETAIERTVAMKIVLNAESPDALARFVTEAKVTGQLEHPHIVPVHELGVDEKEQVFYTMKFVRGDTLRKVLGLLAKGDAETIAKYPLAHLLTIFQKVCDAMAFAHSKGVIHRDLKPDNIMLGDYGEVLVMDWGLAKVLGSADTPVRAVGAGSGGQECPPYAPAEQPRVASASVSDSGHEATMAGTIMGTPQYMPPEQAHGWIEQLDARSDIYSLGAILYHILTLQPSVTGDDAMQVLFKVSNGEIVP
ncbi:MAG: serine/threonine-protein kinase, partial [Verrucomicrobia bacterium]|nr:serine/threonine-protein kinase [Verrucomicrobiota bacterium]